MDKEYFEVCVCSLLHDIGKFAWRVADEQKAKTVKGEWMSHEDWNNRIVRDIKNKNISFRYWSKVSQPENNCVWLGDWISAQERDDLDEEDTQDEKINVERVKSTPLLSIFGQINKREKKIYCKHANLSLELPSNDSYMNGNYSGYSEPYLGDIFDKNLYISFEKQIKDVLDKYDIEIEEQRYSMLRELNDLLKRYLVNIPSAAYKSKSDIDLYNHSKTACAISSCLYKFYLENKEQNAKFLHQLRENMKGIFLLKSEASPVYTMPIFILIKGNFSGIQDFVSTIATDKAIKMLKSRSSYISLLNKVLPLRLIRELDLPETNIIFADGGNFEIIAPNIKETESKLKEFSKEVNSFFWEKFGINLFLHITTKEMSAESFSRHKFSKEFNEDNNEIRKSWRAINSKEIKFIDELKEITDSDGSQKLKSANDKCSVCSQEAYKEDLKDDKCYFCREFENLRDCLKIWQIENKMEKIDMGILKLHDKKLTDYLEYNSKSRFYPKLRIDNGIYELFPIGLPLKADGAIIDFDEILSEASKRTGTRKLGALKFDVDNLGKLFSKGWGDDATISLYSSLSFRIGLFFSGIVPALRERYKEDIYIIYSGGDDSFIVGAWDKVLDFAKDVYSYFRIYVNHHDNITISASYGIFDPKYPVKKIFEKLENDLEKAKSFDSEKGRITIFGFPVKWDYVKNFEKIDGVKLDDIQIEKMVQKNDFESILLISNYFTNLVKSKDKEKIPRGLLQRIIDLADEILESAGPSEGNIKPVWRMKYYLKRNIDAEKIRETIGKLWEKFCFHDISDYIQQKKGEKKKSIEKLNLLKIAVKISQLKTRGGE